MPDENGKRTLKEMMAMFGTLDRPVGITEFKTFWESLTDAEKEYYKTEKI